ncbi:histidine phosphatase family protein [Thiomicrorhabdus indica]|uniref:histidine phosphatase family protein n=1 Tax=Thiomicrorhabdus indica TaxID=2267253 RepID=UPI002AA667A3|nr:histidine phosphatase family protein [Thiomicrorhabdus indica]
MMVRLHFFRHGQCEDNAFLRGRCNSDLSERGLQGGLHNALKVMSNGDHFQEASYILSSPANRCQQLKNALQSLYPHLKSLPDAKKIAPYWQERDFGVLDGLSYPLAQAEFPSDLEAYLESPFEYTPLQAESFAQFKERMFKAWNLLLQQVLKEGIEHSNRFTEVVVVTHGGPIRWIFSKVTGAPIEQTFHLQLGYNSIMTLEVMADQKLDDYGEPIGVIEPFVRLVSLTPGQIENDDTNLSGEL